MTDSQKQILLKVARDSIEAAVNHYPAPKPQSNDLDLNKPCGCFVTLKNEEELRGCIGQFIADKPLIEMVAEMAKASATGDPRFLADRITPNELPCLDVEISVLSLLKKTDNPLSLRLGIDGIYIKRGFLNGCFLPQVATETGWTEEEFLSNCCTHKAGLPPDAWKDKKTEVFLFTADIFSSLFKDIK